MGQDDIIWWGRFRAARKKKKLVKQDFEKQLWRLGREQKALLKEMRNLGYEPLEPPVQKGFKRLFVLRDDVARSSQADFFAGILTFINTVQYSDTREFSRKKRHRGRKIKVARNQELSPLNKNEWRKLKLTPAQAFYFTPAQELSPSGRWQLVYRFIEPWRFRLKVIPNLITQVRVKDFALDKRLTQIKNYLEWDAREMQLHKLQHGYAHYSYFNKSEKLKFQNPLKNIPLPQILEMARQDAANGVHFINL